MAEDTAMSAAERKLADLAKRKAQIAEQEKKLRARLRQERSEAERKRDTRRKILVGALVLSRLDDSQMGERLQAWLARELPGFVRADDLPLFDDVMKPGAANGATTTQVSDSTKADQESDARSGVFGFGRKEV